MRTQRSRIGRRRKVFKQGKAHIYFTGKAVTAHAGMAIVSRALDAFGIHEQLNTVSCPLDADRKFSTSVFLQQLMALRILGGNAISDTAILDGSKNDRVHGLFLDNFPFRDHPFTVLFVDHWRVAGIMQAIIQIIAEEIEEGTNVGIADTLGVRLVTLGESIQKSQDIVG